MARAEIYAHDAWDEHGQVDHMLRELVDLLVVPTPGNTRMHNSDPKSGGKWELN